MISSTFASRVFCQILNSKGFWRGTAEVKHEGFKNLRWAAASAVPPQWTPNESPALEHGRRSTMLSRKCKAFLGKVQIRNFSGGVPKLDEGSFSDYIKRHKSVFVMWYDPSCPMCSQASPHFEMLHNEMKGSMAFAMVDKMANQYLAVSQNITIVPTFRLYRGNGEGVCKQHEGMLDYGGMRSFAC